MNYLKMIKLSLAPSLVVLLAACAAPTSTTLSDGTTATRIACDGTGRGLNYCFERAGKSCGAAGYTILDDSGRVLGKSDVADAGTDRLVRQYAEDQSSILIRCGS